MDQFLSARSARSDQLVHHHPRIFRFSANGLGDATDSCYGVAAPGTMLRPLFANGSRRRTRS